MSVTQTAASTMPKFFQPRRLGHVNLVVTDVDQSMDFYKRVVGFEEAYRQPKVRAGFLSNGSTHHDIGLVESAGPLGKGRPPGLNHTAFELETEVDLVAGYKRAIAAGVKFDRTADHDIAHSAYGVDTDGNQYEIYADVIHNWRAARHGVVTKPKPNWSPGSTPPHAERNYHPNPEIRRVEDAVFHPLAATHAVLAVENFASSFDDYHDVVGLELVAGGRDAAFAIFGGTCGTRSLGLFHTGNGFQPGLHHVGFEVADDEDLDDSIRRAKSAGVVIESTFDHPARRGVFICDIDGIRLQFYIARTRDAKDLGSADTDTALFLA